MSAWGPTPEQERWLTLAGRLRGLLPRDALAARAGGWKTTGPYARIALFVLGGLASVMFAVVLGFGNESLLMIAGLAAIGAAEWLKAVRRLHASGFEEGLYLGGALMAALWIVERFSSGRGMWLPDSFTLAVVAATALVGLRLLNPFLTTCAAVIALDWLESTAPARAIDTQLGGGFTELALASATALIALAAGTREIHRPSLDRMLDGLVVVLPLAAYLRHASVGLFGSFAGVNYAPPVRWIVCAMLIAVAAASLYAGLRRRRHAPLLGLLAALLCLAVELRMMVGGPVEAWLVAVGLGVLGASALLERRLREPRAGITSGRLTDREGPLDLLQSVGAAVLVGAGRPDAPPPADEHAGRFGGGGASGSF